MWNRSIRPECWPLFPLLLFLIVSTQDALLAEPAKKEPAKGYVGIRMQSTGGNGVLIDQVVPNQPADKGGMKPDDIVVAIDGNPVHDTPGLIDGISNKPPGTTINLTVRRGPEKVELSLVTIKRPNFNPILVQEHPPRVDGGSWEMEGGTMQGAITMGANTIVSGNESIVDGSFEQGFSGLLDFEIERRDNHAALSVTGDVRLSGILYVNIRGFTPRDGDEFVIIRNARTLKGEFGKLIMPKLPDGLRWKIVYDDLPGGLDLNGNGRHDVTLLVLKEGSGNDRP